MTRKISYRFRVLPTRRQLRELERWTAVARYVWNFCLSEYEAALDISRAQGEEKTGSIRDILEQRMIDRGVEVTRRGKSDRKMALKSIMYAIWRHHRDTAAPAWVRDEVHSHVGSYASQRLCDTVKRWWDAPNKGKKRAQWITSSERRAGKRPRRKSRVKGSQGNVVGPPRYKRRGDNPSFSIQAKEGVFDRSRIVLPKPIGSVRVHGRDDRPDKRVPEGASPKVYTVRKVADHWDVSVSVVEPWETPKREPKLACGIDLGINAVATIAWSDGRIERVEPPRPMERLGVNLRILQVRLSWSKHVLRCRSCGYESPLGTRDKRLRACPQILDGEKCGGRMRRWRSKRGMRLHMRIAKLHDRIARIREDHLDKLSERIVREADAICTEPHNVVGLVSAGVARRVEGQWRRGLRRRDIRRSMLDIGWGMLRQKLEYKAEWHGAVYETMPAGSKTDQACWRCGRENKMPDNTSDYRCVGCRWVGTRQENTARLCLGYIDFGGEPVGPPGGDPVAARKNGPAGSPSVNGTRGPDSDGRAGIGVVREDYPGAAMPPGNLVNSKKARNTSDLPRQTPRARSGDEDVPENAVIGKSGGLSQ